MLAMEPMGLIAGGGDLPRLEVEGMRAAGRSVVGVGLAGFVDDDSMPSHCEAWQTISVARVGRWAKALRSMGATQAVMVGTVSKRPLMSHPATWLRFLPDFTTLRYLAKQYRRDMRSQTLLAGLCDVLDDLGIELIDTTTYIPDHLATPGTMTTREPTSQQREQIEFGWPILERMNELDVGQGIAVRRRDVVAVEAIEGTDAMIERAGQLAGKDWVMLKGAPASKDPRFDVPTVGVQTIHNLAKAGATCLALAAGRVIMVDKPQVVAAADRAGIAIVGMPSK